MVSIFIQFEMAYIHKQKTIYRILPVDHPSRAHGPKTKRYQMYFKNRTLNFNMSYLRESCCRNRIQINSKASFHEI